MTTYKKNVYKGYSFTYTIKKEKYWDKTVTKSISANTVDNVTLEPYDGVTIAYNAPVVNISEGQLPDGITFDAFVGYPNGVYGSEYLISFDGYSNYAKVGTPIVKEDTGVVSGFTSGSYVTSPSALPSSTYFDMIQKVDFNGSTSEQCIWFTSADRPISFNGAKLGVYQSGWHQGTTVYTAGTYWIRAIYDAQTLKLYVLTDDGYTLDTLPALESWTLEVTFTGCTDAWSNQTLLLSRNNNTYWQSSMYLSGTKVSTASEVVWTADGEATSILPGIALDWGVNDFGGEHTDFYHCPDDTIAMRHYDTTELPDGAVWIGELNQKFLLNDATRKVNFTQVGEVTYSGEVASLAEDSSLLANKNTPTINEFFPVNTDFITKVNATTLGSYKVILRNTSNVHFGMYNQTWYISDTSRETGGTAELNKTYWVRVVQTAQTSAFTTALYYMEDDGTYTINTLPEVSNTNWTKAFEVAKQAFMNNEAFSLGDSGGTGSFTGTIDLANTMMRTFSGTVEPTYTLYWKSLGEE